jgi:hypothetical protein
MYLSVNESLHTKRGNVGTAAGTGTVTVSKASLYLRCETAFSARKRRPRRCGWLTMLEMERTSELKSGGRVAAADITLLSFFRARLRPLSICQGCLALLAIGS